MGGVIQKDRSLIIEPITLDGLNFPGTPLSRPRGNASAEVSLAPASSKKTCCFGVTHSSSVTTGSSIHFKKMFAVHLLAFHFTKLKEDQIKKVRKIHC